MVLHRFYKNYKVNGSFVYTIANYSENKLGYSQSFFIIPKNQFNLISNSYVIIKFVRNNDIKLRT